MKKKWLIGLGIGIVIVIAILWFLRVKEVNKEYNSTVNSDNKEVYMGEKIVANNGITYCVEKAVMYDYAAAVHAFPEYEWNDAESIMIFKDISEGNEYKLLLYEIQMDVGTEMVPMPDTVETESGLWQSVSSPYLFEYFNQDIELIQNETVTYRIPIRLSKDTMSDEEWKRLEEDDPGLQIVLCYQPEQVIYHINQVEHITASNEDNCVMQDKIEFAVEMFDRTNERVVYEDNMVDGQGECQGFTYSLNEVIYYDENQRIDGADEFYEGYGDFLSQREHYYQYVVTFDVENNTDSELQNYINVACLCATPKGDSRLSVNCEMMAIYYSDELKEGKNAGLLKLQPGEKVSVRAVFLMVVSDYSYLSAEELSELEYYFVLGQGQQITTTNDKGALFIHFLNGMQTE